MFILFVDNEVKTGQFSSLQNRDKLKSKVCKNESKNWICRHFWWCAWERRLKKFSYHQGSLFIVSAGPKKTYLVVGINHFQCDTYSKIAVMNLCNSSCFWLFYGRFLVCFLFLFLKTYLLVGINHIGTHSKIAGLKKNLFCPFFNHILSRFQITYGFFLPFLVLFWQWALIISSMTHIPKMQL